MLIACAPPMILAGNSIISVPRSFRSLPARLGYMRRESDLTSHSGLQQRGLNVAGCVTDKGAVNPDDDN